MPQSFDDGRKKKLRLKIITPSAVKLDCEADMVVIRCTTGEMGVLPGHQPHSAVLAYGALRYINEGIERRLAVYGGFAEINGDVFTVLTQDAEWPEEIDRVRAESYRALAKRKQEKTGGAKYNYDREQMKRSSVQISIFDHHVGGEDDDEE